MKRRRAGDAGFTLTELLVVITLTGVIGSAITAAITTGLHKQSQIQDRNDAMAQARATMQRIERDIRSSYPGICSATATSLSMQEVQSSGTRTMTYSVVADGSSYDLVVTQRDVPCATSAAATPTKTMTLVRHLLMGTSQNPVFGYSPYVGYSAPSTGGVDASSCALTDSAYAGSYDPSCIGTVTTHLMIQPATLSAPVDMTDKGVELRNLP